MTYIQSYKVTDNIKNEIKQWPQYLTLLTAHIMHFSMGLHNSWSSPSLPKLLEGNLIPNITSNEASSAIIIDPIGAFVGAPLMAYLSDIIGRKNGILIVALPAFVAWMTIAFAQNIIMLSIGRFIAGIGDGFLFTVLPMYLGEVTDPHVRGIAGFITPFSMIISSATINVYATYVSIRTSALIASVFPIIAVITFSWMPESPYFYLMKGKNEKARQSLKFLKRCDVDDHFQQLKEDVERQMSERGTWKDLFLIKSNRKALLICLAVRTVQQSSGIYAFILFTQSIFIQSGGVISPVTETLICLFFQLVMIIIGSFLMEKFGKRPLLLISSLATSTTLFVSGIYYYLKEVNKIDTSSFSWLPLPLVLLFIFTFSIGLAIAPNLIMSELFSTSVKGKCLCIVSMYNTILASIISKLFYFLAENFGLYASSFTFSALLLIFISSSIYFIPETKGKTLEEIQQLFKKDANNET